jgi:hypothetical protein
MPRFANAHINLSNAQNFIKLKKLSILPTPLYKDYICCISQLSVVDVPEKESHISIKLF